MAGVTTRQRYLDAAVDLMVAEGRTDQSLAALAKGAGTSDRMLVYYFSTRDALVAEAVDHLRERRRQLATTVMARVSQAPSAVEGIASALNWLADRSQISVIRLLRNTTAGALGGDELLEAFVDGTLSDWVEEATLTGRRIGADPATAEIFATTFLALADGLATDRLLTNDTERLDRAIAGAAAMLAHLVGAPITPPPPNPAPA